MIWLNQNSKANQKWKDSFFTKLFSDPKSILKLYNALTGSQYPPETPVEITTLENVLYKGRYNDVSFIVGGKLVVLIEHQSTVNPNMPVRLLIYIARVYDGIVKGRDVYSSKPLALPRPEFVVLYNGTEDFPDEEVLRLSDAFCALPDGHKPSGSLELAVRVVNINKGRNQDITGRSLELAGYVEVVHEIRSNKAMGMGLEEAIAKAVRDCAGRNMLPEFLAKHGGEVMDMLYHEWNLDEYVAVREEDVRVDVAKALLVRGDVPGEVASVTGLPLEQVYRLTDALALSGSFTE